MPDLAPCGHPLANWENPYTQLFLGDCREVLAQLPAESVDCVVTSPPYWGLRRYEGNQELVWDETEKGCEHSWQDAPPPRSRKEADIKDLSSKEVTKSASAYNAQLSHVCSKCGAWHGAYGLEPTIEMYVAHSVEILHQVRRELKKTGTVWYNIGDSYSATRWTGTGKGQPMNKFKDGYRDINPQKNTGLPAKNLCLIPFRLAIALQEDGWWVRSVIIWSKENPMPESVRDRPTEAHDYILMLTKAERYYFDQEAVRMPYAPGSVEGREYPMGAFGSFAGEQEIRQPSKKWGITRMIEPLTGANLRSVWEFSTQSYEGAHFATFPEELPKRCIRASTSEKGNCPKCGKPWVRMTKPTGEYEKHLESLRKVKNRFPTFDGQHHSHHAPNDNQTASYETFGWKPSCSCGEEAIPAVVLDPFVGSGTTCAVAQSLGRKSIGIDLSEDYLKLAQRRIEEVPLPMRI